MNYMYPQDQAGRFSSDVHRRVLAHLSTPADDYGWSEPALFERMRPDVGTELQDVDELSSILSDLANDGHAVRHDVGGGVWQMTEDGFNVLTGPIENEPGPDAARVGPAIINAPGVAAATRLSGEGPAGVDPDSMTITSEDVANIRAEGSS